MSAQPQNESAYPLTAKPCAGVGLHFSSLPSPYGIGDVGDAAVAFIDGLAAMKLRVWQFLPTGPTAFGDSPYQSLSAFAGNENLIGLEPLVRVGLLNDSELEPLRKLPADRVDYKALIPMKRTLLELAADRFEENADAALTAAFDRFLGDFDTLWLADYAIYRVLKHRFSERPWPEWPERFRRRDAAALVEVERDNPKAIRRVKIQQFFFDQQWRNLKAHAEMRDVRLFGDMPIYIALDSSDAWSHPQMLCLDEQGVPSRVAGVPPDYFSADGQLWGNPLYDWARHARQGFRWWAERLRWAMRQYHLVRIDHFRGFEAYWSVPFGESTARNGRWDPGPGDALFETIKATMGAIPVVAEDLGVITPEVIALREQQQFPGMVVLQFAVDDPDFVLSEIDPHSVCYTGTHDNDTTRGWFEGAEDATRTREEVLFTRDNALRISGGAEQTIALDMIRLAFKSPARLAIVPMQDLLGLGSAARMNTPGTTRDNWQWRLLPGQFTDEFRRGVAQLVKDCARA